MSTLATNGQLSKDVLLRLRTAHEQLEDALQVTLLVPVVSPPLRAELSVMRDDLERMIADLESSQRSLSALPRLL